jgi:CHU_C Type IX secretion signal domain
MKSMLFLHALLIAMQAPLLPYVTEDPYKGCCGTKAVEENIGKSLVYIPNIFTPNNDGINDVFKPFYDPSQMKVTNFKVFNAKSELVWEKKEVKEGELASYWFAGVTKDSTYTGVFNYSMEFTSASGENKVITGSACSVKCKEKTPIGIEDKSKCFFPMQFQKDSVNHFSPIHIEVECLSN